MNNPHSGSSFEDFIEQEELELLTKAERVELELLAKSCPRCGKPSANKGNSAGRCRKCLNKLKHRRHTPGDSYRAHYVADAALRRQDGKNGTAHHKSSGRGSRKSIVAQTQRAEKKTHQELSPDRIDNSKGYAASNTRLIDKKLNVGRHKVDPKKLAAWRKKLKKSEKLIDEFRELLLKKSLDTNNLFLIELLKACNNEELAKIIDLESMS